MSRLLKTHLFAATGLLLASCGGGGGGSAPSSAAGQPVQVVDAAAQTSVAAPTPTPSPTPTATPTPTPTAAAPATTEAARLLLADKVFYSNGSYIAYASPWCTQMSNKLVLGTDVKNTISLVPTDFPHDVRMSAKAPQADPNTYGCGVYGYNHIAFGNYDGGVPKVAVAPRRVSAIKSLRVTFDASRSGPGEYNILNEFYLTSVEGDSAAKLVEIGYFLHPSASAVAFARTGSVIGDYADPSGSRWRVTKVGTFVMLMPQGADEVLSGTLDVADLLSFLTKSGTISSSAWFNGMANGVEPVKGESNVTINRWEVSLK